MKIGFKQLNLLRKLKDEGIDWKICLECGEINPIPTHAKHGHKEYCKNCGNLIAEYSAFGLI
ncbi:MAG: hypothetical protein ACTSXD_13495 [Candidatus Heimdallarchaeaceae archaeon]